MKNALFAIIVLALLSALFGCGGKERQNNRRKNSDTSGDLGAYENFPSDGVERKNDFSEKSDGYENGIRDGVDINKPSPDSTNTIP